MAAPTVHTVTVLTSENDDGTFTTIDMVGAADSRDGATTLLADYVRAQEDLNYLDIDLFPVDTPGVGDDLTVDEIPDDLLIDAYFTFWGPRSIRYSIDTVTVHSAPPATPPAYQVALDADAVRDEALDWDNPSYDPGFADWLEETDDATIGEAISTAVDDTFWGAYDSARGLALDILRRQYTD